MAVALTSHVYICFNDHSEVWKIKILRKKNYFQNVLPYISHIRCGSDSASVRIVPTTASKPLKFPIFHFKLSLYGHKEEALQFVFIFGKFSVTNSNYVHTCQLSRVQRTCKATAKNIAGLHIVQHRRTSTINFAALYVRIHSRPLGRW
jgi:hypothetical protein